ERVQGVALVGGVPRGLLVAGGDIEVFAEEWWARHRARRADRWRRGSPRPPQLELYEDPLDELVAIASDELRQLRSQTDDPGDETTSSRAFRPHNRRALELLESDEVSSRFSDFLERLGGSMGESQQVLVPSRGVAARLLDSATAELRTFLGSVRYLGPLRH